MTRAVAILALAIGASAADAQSLKVGARAPEIDLPAIAGGRVKLSTLRGHPVVVTFWQTWCPSCRTEFPELISAYRAHVAAGLEVIAINDPSQEHSSGDGTKHVRQFVDEFSVPFAVTLDKRGRARDAYGILTLPTTLFVDSAGVVQAINRGPTSREELERGIASILPPGGLE
jgi:cytochrome c biogenesis protein CcmG, thiol:disulfide interchange protein DsbE